MEIPKLEVTKQTLDILNSDLEKDLQRMDEANQVLLKKIQEKEETIQRSGFVGGWESSPHLNAPLGSRGGWEESLLLCPRIEASCLNSEP